MFGVRDEVRGVSVGLEHLRHVLGLMASAIIVSKCVSVTLDRRVRPATAMVTELALTRGRSHHVLRVANAHVAGPILVRMRVCTLGAVHG